MYILKSALNGIAAIAALIAAILWFQSARVSVPASETKSDRDEHGMFPARILVNNSDFIATAYEQTRWSKWAALAAGVAALAQAASMVI